MSEIAYKFVQHDVPELETLKDSFPYRMKVKLLNNEPLTREEKNRLATELSTSRTGSLRLRGWEYNFKNLLTEYWVKFNYGGIQAYFAPDKTSLRKCLNNINYIVVCRLPQNKS